MPARNSQPDVFVQMTRLLASPDEFASRLAELNTASARATEAEHAASARLAETVANESRLNDRIKYVETRTADLDVREARLTEGEGKLSEGEASLSDRSAKLTARENAVTDRESQIAALRDQAVNAIKVLVS